MTTWHFSDGITHNRIDFILILKRFQSSVNKNKTRIFLGPDIGSDHDLVMMNIKLKLKKQKLEKSYRIKHDLEKLKDPNVLKNFQTKISGRFAALMTVGNIDEAIEKFNTINQTALDTLRKKKYKRQTL